MSLKEKMMDSMMGKMSKEEKKAMMSSMMENFFDDMTPEDKQGMMQEMMPKMMGGGMPMMGMMQNMMGGMKEGKEGGFNPMDMCKKMMENMSRSNTIAEFATPELRGLFEDWVQQIEEEILQFVQEHESVDPEEIAAHFKLSKNSVIYLLSKLAQKDAIKFKSEKASGKVND